MPRYFFHVQDGRFAPDKEGVELPTMKDVRQHAIGLSQTIMLAEEDHFWDEKDWQITVADASSDVVWTLNFSASV